MDTAVSRTHRTDGDVVVQPCCNLVCPTWPPPLAFRQHRDHKWLGMAFEKVARSWFEIGPPLGDLDDILGNTARESWRLPAATSADIDGIESNEKSIGQNPLGQGLIGEQSPSCAVSLK